MRTTVDLPPAVHRRARELAAERGQSLSALIAELTVRALADEDMPVKIATDDRTGMPMLFIGRPITSEMVAEFLDDE